MAVLIVVAVVWAIVNMDSPAGEPDIAKLAANLSLGLSEGCEIAGMEMAGQRLAVRTEGQSRGADCGRIYIVDLSRGEVVSIVER